MDSGNMQAPNQTIGSFITTASSATSIPLPVQMLLVVAVGVLMLAGAGAVLWLLWHPHEVGARLSTPASGGLISRLFLGIALPAFPMLYSVQAFGQETILWWDWRMQGFQSYTGAPATALAAVFFGISLLMFFHFYCSPIRGLELLAGLGKVVSLLVIVTGVIAFLVLEGALAY